MDMQGRLPVGIQTFADIRRRELCYVDKTKYVAQLISSGFKSIFLSRPHRFGKSLFLSTLKAYFEGKKELFEGLYIAGVEDEIARVQKREPWEESPVLHFDFNAKDYSTCSKLTNRLEAQLSYLEKLYEVRRDHEDPDDRFIHLISSLYRKTGKQVVILIDEYDKPLLETVTEEGLNEANRVILKSFYEALKQCDSYIRFAFLTGITKFSKTTLFSGVNNLVDITLVDDYAAICGFTAQELSTYFAPEIEQLARNEESTVEETRARLKKEYDGYLFSPEGESVYNPFSLLNVLTFSRFNYYWFETATPSYLINYLKRTRVFVPNLDTDLKIGINAIQDFRYNAQDSVIPLLFQAGYLTIKSYLKQARLFQLGYPNEEVRFGFLEELLPLYTSFITRVNIEPTIWDLYEQLDNGDLAGAMKQVEDILAGILYGNIPNDESGRPLREQYYQSVLYAVFRLLGLHAQAEVVCATGRVDMVVKTAHHLYIFEFKVTTQGTAQDAITQIKERGYIKMFSSDDRPIHLVGVSFDEKTRNIGEWKEVLVPDGRCSDERS